MRKLYPYLLAVMALLAACDPEPIPTEPSVLATEDLSDTTVLALSKVQEVALAARGLWSEDFTTLMPSALLLPDEHGQEQLYLLAPHLTDLEGLQELELATNDLPIYRYDAGLVAALEALPSPQVFTFSYVVAGQDYMLARKFVFDSFYNDYKDQGSNFVPLVWLHEVWHTYQFAHWNMPAFQQTTEPAWQGEFFALRQLQYDLTVQAYSAQTPEEQRAYLEGYVATYEAMAALGADYAHYMEHQFQERELIEGTARFIEVFSAEASVFPTVHEDPTHGFGALLDTPLSRGAVETVLFFRAAYHQGAIATHLVQVLGGDIETPLKAGQTPFAMAKAFLGLTDEESAEALAAWQAAVDWPAYQQLGEQMAALFVEEGRPAAGTTPGSHLCHYWLGQE